MMSLDGVTYFTEMKADLETVQGILDAHGYLTKIFQNPGEDPELTFSFKLEKYPNTKGYLRWYKHEELDLSYDERRKLEELAINPITGFDVLYRNAWKKEMLAIMKLILPKLGGCLLSEYLDEFFTLSNLDKLEKSLPDR